MLKTVTNIVNASQITGVLPVVNGGTGVTTSTGTGSTVLSAAPTLSGNVTLSTGNLIVASGQGIDFSATPGTGTSELLADYEEGTWTPTLAYSISNGDLNYTAGYQTGTYTKVGRLVTVAFYLLFNETTASGNLILTNLPFATANITNTFCGGAWYLDNMIGFTGAPIWQINQSGGTTMGFSDSAAGTPISVSNINTVAGNNVIRVIASYYSA